MTGIQLTRLGDFLSAGSTAHILNGVFFRWWLIAVGLGLVAVTIALYARSGTSG